jgi:hypothetical protein
MILIIRYYLIGTEFIFGLFNDDVSSWDNIYRRIVGQIMKNELQRLRNKAVVA